MTSGKLGAADLAAATATLLYTVPASTITTANVRFANRNNVPTEIRLAIGTGGSPAGTDYVTYGQTLPQNGIIEDMGLVLSAGEKIWAYATIAGVSVRVHGHEEVV